MILILGMGLLMLALVILIAACSARSTQIFAAQNPAAAGPSDPSQFRVLGLNVTPGDAQPGQPVTISVDILNRTNTAGNFQADLVINSATESSQLVAIPAGNTQTINYKVTKTAPGDYRVTFANLSTVFSIGDSGGQIGGTDQASTTITGTTTSAPSGTASCCSPTGGTATQTTSGASCSSPSGGTTTQQNNSATSAWGTTGGSCCGK
jgi:hypothetical protein